MKRELKQWIRPDCRLQPENEPEPIVTEPETNENDEQEKDGES